MVNKLFIIIGFISLTLGIIGVFVPLLPTTPFLLLTATLFFKASPRLYQRLIQNRWCGKIIENYQKGKGVPIQMKIYALLILWGSILSTVFFLENHLLVKLFLLLIASAVSVHIIFLKSIKE